MVYNLIMERSSIHSRRDFLVDHARVRAVENAISHTTEERKSSIPPQIRDGYLLTISRRAMACQFEVRLNSSRETNETAAAIDALDLIETIEDQLTVYRPHSEVMEINRRAAIEAVEVEPQLFALLELAGEQHASSEGAFDITSGPISKLWGHARREGRLPTDLEIAHAQANVGWNKVELRHDLRTIEFRQPGVEINFNSLGKGFALDRATELLIGDGVCDFIFHGGRSTLVARGNNAAEAEGGWKAGLRHPLRPQLRIAEFTLRDKALSTSGSATQFFRHRGRNYGHLLDPRTGWPAEGMHSATVIAPTGAEADGLSTAFYVMGADAVQRYCSRRTDIQALLVLPGSKSGSVEIATFNLPESDWRPISHV